MLTEKLRQTISALTEATTSNKVIWYLDFDTDVYNLRVGEYKVQMKVDCTSKLNIYNENGNKVSLIISTGDNIVSCVIFRDEPFYLRSYLHTDETAKKCEIWVADCKLCTLLLKAADENEKAHRYISKDVDFDLDKLMRNLNKE